LLYRAVATKDDGCIVSTYSQSSDYDVNANYGKMDAWIFKFDKQGNISWKKNFGGSKDDYLSAIVQTTGDGYIAAGTTLSNDNDLTGLGQLNGCLWLLKLDKNGNKVWLKVYNRDKGQACHELVQLKNGDYIAGGTTTQSLTIAKTDGWLFRVSATGVPIWQEDIGSSENDDIRKICEINDSSFVLAGFVAAGDLDATGTNYHAMQDSWILKFENSNTGIGGVNVPHNVQVYPTITSGIVHVQLPQGYTEAEVYLVNALGQRVFICQWRNAREQKLLLQNIPAGVYTLCINSGSATSVHKIIYKP
jgi:hypothetical protein